MPEPSRWRTTRTTPRKYVRPGPDLNLRRVQPSTEGTSQWYEGTEFAPAMQVVADSSQHRKHPRQDRCAIAAEANPPELPDPRPVSVCEEPLLRHAAGAREIAAQFLASYRVLAAPPHRKRPMLMRLAAGCRCHLKNPGFKAIGPVVRFRSPR